MARAQTASTATPASPSGGTVVKWIVGGVIAIALAVAAYFAVVGSGYKAPSTPNAPYAPSAAPATAAPGGGAPATAAPAPAAPRYP